jgi:hypothetical protein
VTYNEAEKFFNEEIRPRWPDWTPTGVEIKDWCNVIYHYAILVAMQAIQNYIRDANKVTRRPLIAHFITKANLLVPHKETEKYEHNYPPGTIVGAKAREISFRGILDGTRPMHDAGFDWLVNILKENPKLIPAPFTLETLPPLKRPMKVDNKQPAKQDETVKVGDIMKLAIVSPRLISDEQWERG